MKQQPTSKLFIWVAILLGVLIAVLIIGFKNSWWAMGGRESYYGVFLTNGQVYFGHIKKVDNSTLVLTNVYYLQTNVTQNTQAEVLAESDAHNLEVELVKLGNEIHGPTDEMMINRTHILFWEQLRNEGKVVQAIKSARL